MSRARRTVRHPDHGPNRNKVRIGMRKKRLSERLRDLALELDSLGYACNGHRPIVTAISFATRADA